MGWTKKSYFREKLYINGLKIYEECSSVEIIDSKRQNLWEIEKSRTWIISHWEDRSPSIDWCQRSQLYSLSYSGERSRRETSNSFKRRELGASDKKLRQEEQAGKMKKKILILLFLLWFYISHNRSSKEALKLKLVEFFQSTLRVSW